MTSRDSFSDPHSGPLDPFLGDPNDPSNLLDDLDPVEPLSDDIPADGPGVLRVRITPSAARAFAQRALNLVAAGRPPCPLCGLPLDANGHVCPRQNGHRAARA